MAVGLQLPGVNLMQYKGKKPKRFDIYLILDLLQNVWFLCPFSSFLNAHCGEK